MTAVERHYRLWLMLLWLGCAGAAIALSWPVIVAWELPDPDDVMRLVEVRDWMAGQSWFDVSQHRMNLPAGLSMHWSRLLDLPLAAIIALFQPWCGQRVAETIAAVAVPMVTLGATMVLVAEMTRRRSGAPAALLAAASCMLSVGSWYALRPLRIDHHGWQIVAGLGLVLALLDRRPLRGAIIAGLCAAAWTHISLEGLAFTAGVSAWLGLRWILSPVERLRLPVFLASLTGSGAILYLSVHGTALIGRTFCDQVSPVHLILFGTAAALTYVAARFAPHNFATRAGAMAVAAIVCGIGYRLAAPQCAGGPFAALGPLGYRLWYLHVNEGVPIWHQPLALALLWGLFPFVGLAGALLASLRPGADRTRAIDYCALLVIATAIGLLVTRAGAFTNLLALPGAITLILLALDRTASWPLPARVVARTVVLLLLTPDGAALAATLVPAHEAAATGPAEDPHCARIDRLAMLDRFAPTTIIAPLDLGPLLLAATHHAAITGPYHRDPAAMEDALGFFAGSDAGARAIVARRAIGLIVFCPGDSEMALIASVAPRGLAARLAQGRPIAWLRRVDPGDTVGPNIYQILR